MDDAKVPTTTTPVQSSTESYVPSVKPALPQADSKRPDPLQMPEQFNRPPMESKPISKKSDPALVPAAAVTSTAPVKPAAAVTSTTQAKPLETMTSTVTAKPVATMTSTASAMPPQSNMPATVQTYSPGASMPVPLGAKSVIQAGDPGPGGVRYVPVPMVTIPDAKRAPAPPMMNSPQVYGTPGPMTAGPNTVQANAFAPAPARQTLASNAFGPGAPAVVSGPYGQSTPTFGSAGMMAQGMPPSGSFPAMPPNSIVPAGYHTMTNDALTPAAHLGAVKPTAENIHQMEATLRDSLYPSQREWAAESMAAVDWRTHPQVVQALTTAAKEDPAPTVRASCVRCLAAMKVNTLPVVTVVRGLKNDSDPRVRQDAERAWSVLAPGEK
jgi:hypothetical protein